MSVHWCGELYCVSNYVWRGNCTLSHGWAICVWLGLLVLLPWTRLLHGHSAEQLWGKSLCPIDWEPVIAIPDIQFAICFFQTSLFLPTCPTLLPALTVLWCRHSHMTSQTRARIFHGFNTHWLPVNEVETPSLEAAQHCSSAAVWFEALWLTRHKSPHCFGKLCFTSCIKYIKFVLKCKDSNAYVFFL